MGHTEKRRHPRAKVDIQVSWGWDERCASEGRLVNLSAGGCLLSTDLLAARGTRVYIGRLVGRDSVIKGEVRYPLEGLGIGIEFLDLSDDERRVLSEIVESYGVAGAPAPPGASVSDETQAES